MAKTKTVVVPGSVYIDTSDFRSFAKALRNGERALNLAFRRNLREAGDIVANDARARASFSKKILPTIKTRVASTSVSVVAGGAGVPLAGLMELGNAGGRGGNDGTFRHPVFGTKKNWVSEQMHPYLRPALDSRGPEAAERIFEALDDAIAAVVATPNLHEDI